MPYLPSTGPVTLAHVAACTPWLEVACRRCGRYGRLRVARLIEEHGPDFVAFDVVRIVSADCPRRGETQLYELCQVHCPTLPKFMAPGKGPPVRPAGWYGRRR